MKHIIKKQVTPKVSGMLCQGLMAGSGGWDGVQGVRKKTASRVARGTDRFQASKYMSPGRTCVARSEKYFLAVSVAGPLCMRFLQLKNSSLRPQASCLWSSYECRRGAMTFYTFMQRAPFWCFLGNLCLSAQPLRFIYGGRVLIFART